LQDDPNCHDIVGVQNGSIAGKNGEKKILGAEKKKSVALKTYVIIMQITPQGSLTNGILVFGKSFDALNS
jgi:hypothetical protein